MRTSIPLLLTLLLAFAGAQTSSSDDTPAEPRGRYEVFDLASPQLEQTREIVVYLPADYDRGAARYPVVYLQDGQNAFVRRHFAGRWLAQDPARSWRADLAADRADDAGRGAIVVAIPSGGLRAADYLPFEVPANAAVGPRAEAYAAFLADTLKPRIDRDYRTLPGRGATAVVGASYGGVVAIVAGLTRPGTFGFVGALSASVAEADFAIVDWLGDRANAETRIYLDVGTDEGIPPEWIDGSFERVVPPLEALGARLETAVIEGAGHNEAACAARFPDVLERFVDAAPNAD